MKMPLSTIPPEDVYRIKLKGKLLQFSIVLFCSFIIWPKIRLTFIKSINKLCKFVVAAVNPKVDGTFQKT